MSCPGTGHDDACCFGDGCRRQPDCDAVAAETHAAPCSQPRRPSTSSQETTGGAERGSTQQLSIAQLSSTSLLHANSATIGAFNV